MTAAVTIGLLDPAMDRRHARLELPGQVFDAAPCPGQRDYLLPEFRRVRVPRSWHQDTLLRKSNRVHQTGGTPTPVHRYKGHAVRLNIAAGHASAVRGRGTPTPDPWAAMFAAARAATGVESDLVPYWIYEGPTKVERRVPLLPYSTEVARLRWLKKSVAVHRLALGQPRQDDLMEHLRTLREHLSTEDLEALQIRLAPPAT